MIELKSVSGWLAQSLNDGLMRFANGMDFSDIMVEVNRLIQKRSHTLTGHRQSIEYHIVAQNIKKLYFNSKNLKFSLNEDDHINQKTLKSDEIEELKELFEMKMAAMQDTNIWEHKIVFVDEENEIVSFNQKAKLNFKYLMEVINIKYKNYKKQFSELIIENEDIESIEKNDFSEIRFDKIWFRNCPNLKQIHWKAFGKNTQNIKEFYIGSLPKLESIPNTDYDLYELINSLINCEEIIVNSFHHELQAIKLRNLKRFTSSCYPTNRFKSIKFIWSYAFYECDKIEEIKLGGNNINYISEHAFHFRNQSDKILKVYLMRNELNESSFALNSLINFKRPTKLYLSWNNIKYLDEQDFKPFFDANQINEIVIDEYFDENHDSNQWNQSDKNIKLKIKFISQLL